MIPAACKPCSLRATAVLEELLESGGILFSLEKKCHFPEKNVVFEL
jgi:hypothetical protein